MQARQIYRVYRAVRYVGRLSLVNDVDKPHVINLFATPDRNSSADIGPRLGVCQPEWVSGCRTFHLSFFAFSKQADLAKFAYKSGKCPKHRSSTHLTKLCTLTFCGRVGAADGRRWICGLQRTPHTPPNRPGRRTHVSPFKITFASDTRRPLAAARFLRHIAPERLFGGFCRQRRFVKELMSVISTPFIMRTGGSRVPARKMCALCPSMAG